MGQPVKRFMSSALGAAGVLAVVGVAVVSASSPWDQVSEASDGRCQMANVMPSHGTLQLEYLKPSSAQDPDRNDYRLSGTVSWNDQSDLDCYDDGLVDWAYEHSLEYGEPVKRVVWDRDFSAFGDAQPYLDTTVDSNPAHTELTIGIAKPERLVAGRDYSFGYDLMLPNHPEGGKHWIALWGQVVEKQCSSGKPWCSGLNSKTDPSSNYSSHAWVGWTRGFAVSGTTCWKWSSDGSAPVDCSPAPKPEPSQTPVAPASPATAPTEPAPDESSPSVPDSSTPNTEPPADPTTAGPTPTPESDAPPPPATVAPTTTAQGKVNGCDTYGGNCNDNPLYVNVPPDGYNWKTEPKLTTVPDGTVLTARCYATGGTTYNWAHSGGDLGPDPYDSDVYFSVQSPVDGSWGFIPDTYYVRDKIGHLGLQPC